MKKITERNVKKHVDLLIEIAERVNLGEVTILTGGNGLGKSFIRKLVPFKLAEKKNKDASKTFVASTSMEQRTGSNPEWGALSGIMRDVAWTPTSTETLQKIQQLITFKDRFIVIDEPEIGMGEETILAVVSLLNQKIDELRSLNKDFLGVMVITHSKIVVEHLKSDSFINIEGLTKEQWLNRKLIPTDLNDLKERSLTIFREIQKRIDKSNKKSKRK